jgi:hypothetical protein
MSISLLSPFTIQNNPDELMTTSGLSMGSANRLPYVIAYLHVYDILWKNTWATPQSNGITSGVADKMGNHRTTK